MIRVVFDSVVFVRGLMSPFGWWGRLLFDHSADYDLVVSPSVMDEVLEVLQRPRLVRKYRGVATRDLRTVLAILAGAEVVEPVSIPPISRDPKGDKFLAPAKAGGAAFVVSEDQDLLVLGEYDGIRIVNAETFLHLLGDG